MNARPSDGSIVVLVGLTAVVFSALYFVSDVIELFQGGFSTPQLVLTYAAEAAIPFFVLGLYAAQRARCGWLGFVGAGIYAYTFVFFTAPSSTHSSATPLTGRPCRRSSADG